MQLLSGQITKMQALFNTTSEKVVFDIGVNKFLDKKNLIGVDWIHTPAYNQKICQFQFS